MPNVDVKLHAAQARDRDFRGCPFPPRSRASPCKFLGVPGGDRVWGGARDAYDGHLVLCKGLQIGFSGWQKVKNLVLEYRAAQATPTRPTQTGLSWQVPRFLLWVSYSCCLALGISFSRELSCACKRTELISLSKQKGFQMIGHH